MHFLWNFSSKPRKTIEVAARAAAVSAIKSEQGRLFVHLKEISSKASSMSSGRPQYSFVSFVWPTLNLIKSLIKIVFAYEAELAAAKLQNFLS